MCGRFNIIDDPLTQLIVEIWGQAFDVQTHYNIAPTEQIQVLVRDEDGQWSLPSMRWWLVPNWAREPSTRYAMFNARSESLGSSRAFKQPFEQRRCIIPASGYYEWRKEGGIKVPYYIEPAEEAGFAFAGLWDRWQRDDQVIESCTIVTAAAPDSMTAIHHRVPVHLTAEEIDLWVSQGTPASELNRVLASRMKFPLTVSPMSTYVNNARNKDARCVEPLGDKVLIH